MLIEVCCNSINDCLTAQKCGADRIELNSATPLGGLTPSIGLLKEAKRLVSLPVMAMVRPRNAGCFYTDEDFRVMQADAELLIKNGADGIVFGFLTEDGFIDKKRTKDFISCCKGVQTVFHRAIDVAREPERGIEFLISAGVNRILTSGFAPSAPLGKEAIRSLNEKYGKEIEILGGAGLNPQNALDFVRYTGLSQIHLGASSPVTDFSASANPEVDFGHMADISSNQFLATDCEKLSRVIEAVKDL